MVSHFALQMTNGSMQDSSADFFLLSVTCVKNKSLWDSPHCALSLNSTARLTATDSYSAYDTQKSCYRIHCVITIVAVVVVVVVFASVVIWFCSFH